jgi:hypothetical protein
VVITLLHGEAMPLQFIDDTLKNNTIMDVRKKIEAIVTL